MVMQLGQAAWGTSSSESAAVHTSADDAGVADGKAFHAKLREELSNAIWGPEAGTVPGKNMVSQEAQQHSIVE